MERLYYPREPRCKVCMSALRDEIDQMLLGNTLKPDGTPYKLEEISAWCQERGLETSQAALSRHRANHLQPALQSTFEMERMLQSIQQATGQKLSLPRVFASILVAKAMKVLNKLDLDDLTPEQATKAIGQALRASEVLAKLERVEAAVAQQTAQEVGEKLKGHGLSEEVIREIEEQILGLRR